MKAGAPGAGGGGRGLVGLGATVIVMTTWAAVGTGASDATERTCQTPSIGSVSVKSSSPGPVVITMRSEERRVGQRRRARMTQKDESRKGMRGCVARTQINKMYTD